MQSMPMKKQWRAAWLAGLAVLAVALLLLSTMVAMTLAPALLMFAVLVAGRMPGEELIQRLRTRKTARRRLALAGVSLPPSTLVLVRAVRMSASALAMRPPPRAGALSV